MGRCYHMGSASWDPNENDAVLIGWKKGVKSAEMVSFLASVLPEAMLTGSNFNLSCPLNLILDLPALCL